MTTLISVIAYLASMIRCAGAAYIVVQVILWHSFYSGAAWRPLAPALAVAWAVTATVYLRKHPPSARFACADTAVYLALALGAQACVPPGPRDSALSWVVIAMSGQLIVPAWAAPGPLSAPLVLSAPLAYLVGAVLQPVTDVKTMTGAAILLLAIGLVHGWGRRVLGGRAAAADADVAEADRTAREQYAILRGNITRREHERLVHDTVLNTLTAVARGGGNSPAALVTRCRQDVALIESALGAAAEPDGADPATRGPAFSGPAAADLVAELRTVAADMRARGLTVHLEGGDAGQANVPARVATAISSAVREALSNVAAHAGTGEAWIGVHHPGGQDPSRLRVVVRDAGAGFDTARVDRARLGVRRSIAERTAECGGRASIRSAPGQGTEVTLTWPAPEQAGPAQAGHGRTRQDPPW